MTNYAEPRGENPRRLPLANTRRRPGYSSEVTARKLTQEERADLTRRLGWVFPDDAA